MKQPLTLCRLLEVNEPSLQSDIIYDTMTALLENTQLSTAPHFSPLMMSILRKHLNRTELFRGTKEKNRIAVERYRNHLDTLMEHADDPLEMAVRIAITGNTIDLGANPSFNLEQDIRNITSTNLHLESLERLRNDLSRARRILYIADNYEEALFDVYLLKYLFPKEVIFAVRSTEVLNDITLEDAHRLGIDALCRVVESGSRISGTALEQATSEFLEYFSSSDVIIAKGQGNYETLFTTERTIYFLFKVKCEAISHRSGFPLGTGVLYVHEQ